MTTYTIYGNHDRVWFPHVDSDWVGFDSSVEKIIPVIWQCEINEDAVIIKGNIVDGVIHAHEVDETLPSHRSHG